MAGEKVIQAFLGRKSCKIKNDESTGNQLFYRNNKIAWFDDNNNLYINSCGYMTRTTKDRLNKLGKFSLKQKNNLWYINDNLWDGSPINVNIFNKLNKEQLTNTKSIFDKL